MPGSARRATGPRGWPSSARTSSSRLYSPSSSPVSPARPTRAARAPRERCPPLPLRYRRRAGRRALRFRRPRRTQRGARGGGGGGRQRRRAARGRPPRRARRGRVCARVGLRAPDGVRYARAPRAPDARVAARRPPRRARHLRRGRASGSDPVERLHRRRHERPRRLVALLDVSGSMAPCARSYLLLLGGRSARSACRDLRVRHPPHPRHARAARGAARTPRSTGRARPRRTGPAGRGSARRCSPSTTATAGAGWRATPWWRFSPTAGSVATRRCSAARCSAYPASPSDRVGQPAWRRRGSHRRRAGWRSRSRTSTSSSAAVASRRSSSRRWAGIDRRNRVRFENDFDVDAPIEKVWDAVLDVERVDPTVPGPRCSSGSPTTPRRSRSRSRSARCR